MKSLKIVLIALTFISLSTCTNDEDEISTDQKCGFYTNGEQLYKGPEGGCYYINSNGNKTYVERDECNC